MSEREKATMGVEQEKRETEKLPAGASVAEQAAYQYEQMSVSDEKIKETLTRLSGREILQYLAEGGEIYWRQLDYGLQELDTRADSLVEEVAALEQLAYQRAQDKLQTIIKRYQELLVSQAEMDQEKEQPMLAYWQERLAQLSPDQVAENLLKKKNELLQMAKTELQEMPEDVEPLKRFYQKNLASMRGELAKETAGNLQEELFGNAERASKLIEKVQTMNEWLNVAHTYLTQTTELLSLLPRWDDSERAENDGGAAPPSKKVEAYGEKTVLAAQIYQALQKEFDNEEGAAKRGWRAELPSFVKIFNLKNRLEVTVRDYGHALSLVIDNFTPDQEGRLLVKYKVPKIINEEMIKKLPGLNQIYYGNDEASYASGQLTIKADRAGQELIDFVQKVPTDDDSPLVQRVRFDNENGEARGEQKVEEEKAEQPINLWHELVERVRGVFRGEGTDDAK